MSGRYYAMDRDKRWTASRRAYRAIVEAEGPHFADTPAVIADAYANKKFDEFVVPAVVGDYRGVKDGDGVLCFNFRADRVREILGAMLNANFSGFSRRRVVRFAAAVAHADDLSAAVACAHPRRSGGGRRTHTIAYGGDQEVRTRHLFPQNLHNHVDPSRIVMMFRPRSGAAPRGCARRCGAKSAARLQRMLPEQ